MIMRILIKILLVFAFICSFSCEDQGLIVKCPDCYSEEPLETNLEVKLDAAPSGHQTIINVYEGNLEDSVLYNSFRTTVSHTTISVTLNKKFTVTATYSVNDDFYIAVDSATPRVKYDKTQCDDPCYYVYDKGIDLRLKYTK
jgi:hypothetical protein